MISSPNVRESQASGFSSTSSLGAVAAMAAAIVLAAACSSGDDSGASVGAAGGAGGGAGGGGVPGGGSGTAGAANGPVGTPMSLSDPTVHVAVFGNGVAILRARATLSCVDLPVQPGSGCWTTRCPVDVESQAGAARVLPESTIAVEPIGLLLEPGVTNISPQVEGVKPGDTLKLTADGANGFAENLTVPVPVSQLVGEWAENGLLLHWKTPTSTVGFVQVRAELQRADGKDFVNCQLAPTTDSVLMPYSEIDFDPEGVVVATFAMGSQKSPQVYIRSNVSILLPQRK